jgi:hypothetical protein
LQQHLPRALIGASLHRAPPDARDKAMDWPPPSSIHFAHTVFSNLHCLCEIVQLKRLHSSTNTTPQLEMSELKNPTTADWMRWEPKVRSKYKEVTAEMVRQEMKANGLNVSSVSTAEFPTPRSIADSHVHSVKMLRDRYKKWGINNKNKPPHQRRRQIAAASRGLTTQMVLLQSPRIVELDDDESQVVQDLAGIRIEDNLPHHANIRTGPPHAAFSSLDPRSHEILNGLLTWCAVRVEYPYVLNEMSWFCEFALEISYTESKQNLKRFLDASPFETKLSKLRDPWNLLWLVTHISNIGSISRSFSWFWQEKSAGTISRILLFFCQHSVQMLGPRHPVTLLSVWSARGLPGTALLDTLEGIFQIHAQGKSIANRQAYGVGSSAPLVDERSNDVSVYLNLLNFAITYHL